MSTLHLTNGDSAAEGLKRAQLGGIVLPWRDVLHDGPLPATETVAEYRTVRARFLAGLGGGNFADIEQSMSERDAMLEADVDEIVLWFEPDLYDQLQLVEVVARLARRHPDHRPQLTIVPSDDFLGTLEVQYFAPLYRRKRALASDDLYRCEQLWHAITDGTPHDIAGGSRMTPSSVAAQNYRASETVKLPHLKPAMNRWLEELPWTIGGVGRTERQALRILSDGPRSVAYTYHNAHHAQEKWVWLGDWSFAWYMQRMSECAEPLVLFENGERIKTPPSHDGYPAFFQRNMQITEFGRDILSGRADAITTNGIDRWFGGSHLTTEKHWRWNADAQQVA